MKILVLYFSATGNTRHAAEYIAGKLRSAGEEASVASIEELPPEQVRCDMLIMGYPVNAFSLPGSVRNYIAAMPDPDLKGAFVFCTMGAWPGDAVRKGLLALKKRGYVPLGGAAIAMPAAGKLCTLDKNHKDVRELAGRDFGALPQADAFLEQVSTVIARIKSGQPVTFSTDELEIDALPWLSGLLADALRPLAAKYLAGHLKSDAKCTGCGYCARICPSGAITISGKKASFSKLCEMCLRCLNHCPEHSIQLGAKTAGKYRYRGPAGDFRPTEKKR